MKVELKKRESFIKIESFKWVLQGVIIAVIGTPLMMWFMNWFVGHYFGYTLV